jgi:hypothetical protein
VAKSGRRSGGRKNKQYARLIELLISPLWILLLFVVWRSEASSRTVALASAAVAVYYLFFVPRTCGALRSDDTTFCQKDGRGFLIGCGLISHAQWNLRKYFPGGRKPRRRVVAGPRGGGPRGAANSSDADFPGPGKRVTEVLAGLESIVAILSLIVSILAWQFPRT